MGDSALSAGGLPPLAPPSTMLNMGVVVDMSTIQHRLHFLEAKELAERAKELAESEKANVQAKYVKILEKKEAEHRNKIKEMEDEIGLLKNRLAEKDKEYAAMQAQMGDIARVIAGYQRKHTRHLCGSVAYVYVNSAGITLHRLFPRILTTTNFCVPPPLLKVEFVFQGRDRKDIRHLKRDISTIEDIEEESRSKEEETRWEEFKGKYYSSEYKDVLKKLAGDRVGIAHPTTEEEDDDPPGPRRMQEIIREVYKQQNNKNLRETACKLVDSLDSLRRALAKALCEPQ